LTRFVEQQPSPVELAARLGIETRVSRFRSITCGSGRRRRTISHFGVRFPYFSASDLLQFRRLIVCSEQLVAQSYWHSAFRFFGLLLLEGKPHIAAALQPKVDDGVS
jgi:hypothetical protein